MECNIIKKRLGEEIKNSGLSTIEISKRIGVSPEMITQYRTTKKLPKLDTFAKLCKELDLDANYVLGIDEKDQIKKATYLGCLLTLYLIF